VDRAVRAESWHPAELGAGDIERFLAELAKRRSLGETIG
jgi:hypothetical protein